VSAVVRNNVTRSTLRLLEARGHCPNLSAPAEAVAAIQDFVAGGAAATR
jgi:sigma-B regulation protein RsbQ